MNDHQKAIDSYLEWFKEDLSLWHKFDMPDGCVTKCHADLIKGINCDEWELNDEGCLVPKQ